MIVTLEEAREYLRIDEDDTSNDDVIQSSLETAQALCLDLPAARKRMPKRIPSCSMKPSSMLRLFCMNTVRKRTTQDF